MFKFLEKVLGWSIYFRRIPGPISVFRLCLRKHSCQLGHLGVEYVVMKFSIYELHNQLIPMFTPMHDLQVIGFHPIDDAGCLHSTASVEIVQKVV